MPGQRLHVGDEVTYAFGSREVRAKVVEDRGDIGVGGRQLVVIEVKTTDVGGEPLRFEMPAEALTVHKSAAA